jgi:hypothetical protein
VVQHFGCFPKVERLRESPVAYFLTLENLYCQPEPAADQIATLLRPEFMPAEFAGRFRRNVDTTPAACRERLRRTLENRLARLRTTEEQLRTGRDARQRSQVVDPNMMIANPAELQTYSRYASDANSSFLRCYKALEAALQADAERGESADPPANPDPSTAAAGPTPAATATAEPDASGPTNETGGPSAESTEGSAGCVERTEGGPCTTIGALHALDEPIAYVRVVGPEAAESANPFHTNEPTVPAPDAIESSIGTRTCVDQEVPSGTQREPSVPPADGPGEPPVPPSDGRFLVRGAAERLDQFGREAGGVPRPDGGPSPAGPPGGAESRL